MDNQAGVELGRKVAAKFISRAESDGAQRSQASGVSHAGIQTN
jgi:hypothetical protein